MPVMMQMHGLFIDIRLEGIIGIGQRRVLKWVMLVHGNFLLIYVSAGEIDEGGLKKIIACVIIIL